MPQTRRVKLWDPLLRGFHWLLATAVIVGWILGEWGPNIMTLHFWCGYVVAGLLVFRLIWGVIGPRPARFSSFVRGPRAVMAYAAHVADRSPSRWPGHNPMGALSVIALLGLLAAQVTTGLVSDPEDYINTGPLADRVPHDIATDAVGWHNLGAILIAVMVGLHVAMILYYRLWKREDLVRPMITGWKEVRDDETIA